MTLPMTTDGLPVDSDLFERVIDQIWATAKVCRDAQPEVAIRPTEALILVQSLVDGEHVHVILHIERSNVFIVADSISRLRETLQVTIADPQWDGHRRARECQGECERHA